jgi:RNA polymerase sigma-32 factor
MMDEEDVEQEEEMDEAGDEPTETGLTVFDPLRRYLMEIRKYPFLSREEEHRLAILSKSTEYRWGEEALQAITALVLSHLRLVAPIAME